MQFLLVVGVPFVIWLYGFSNELTTVWVPLVAWIGTLASWPFRDWLDSDKLGQNAGVSVTIKLVLQILRLVGTLGFWASLGVASSWLYRGIASWPVKLRDAGFFDSSVIHSCLRPAHGRRWALLTSVVVPLWYRDI